MQVKFSKEFIKLYEKIPNEIQEKFEERLKIFREDINSPYLKVHKLHGEWDGYHSFNVTSDYRVIFEYLDKEHIRLSVIGTHSQLYE